jgi:tRNA (guanine-N7-)-methyltransferase
MQAIDPIDSQQPSHRREIKSFVKRNRSLTPAQASFFKQAYQQYGLFDQGLWDFENIFINNWVNNNHDVILEIGFGNGDTLIKNAQANINTNYIGIEVYQTGVLNILKAIDQVELPSLVDLSNNLRVCQGDAKVLLNNNIKDKSLSGVQIFFPDPWHKTRHHKRRLIQDDFVNLLAKKIKSGGFLHLATDWANYAAQMQQVLNNNINYQNLSLDHGYYQQSGRLLTRFEQRGLNKGHKIFDLKYQVI